MNSFDIELMLQPLHQGEQNTQKKEIKRRRHNPQWIQQCVELEWLSIWLLQVA